MRQLKQLLTSLITSFREGVSTNAARGPVIIAGTVANRIKLHIQLENLKETKSKGHEAWLLGVYDENENLLVNWRDFEFQSPFKLKVLGESENLALLFTESAEIYFDLPHDAHLKFLCHPWSSGISVTLGQEKVYFDLYSPVGSSKLISVGDIVHFSSKEKSAYDWNKQDRAWLDEMRYRMPEILSILHPNWRGVRSATENLVPESLYVEDNLNELSAKRIARLVLETGCTKIMIGGFPLSYELLVKEIKNIRSDIQIYIFWLSSFLQSNEDYAWQSFMTINRLYKNGLIAKIGFAKKGMAETIARTGVKTGFIASYMRKIPEKPSTPKPGGPHIGIWALAPIWRKTPYAMIAAAATIDNASLFMVGQDQRAVDLADYLGVSATFQEKPVPQEKMAEVLSLMDINLYVTLSECSPMLPLESLASGVPCLLGPTSHLFEDNPYLHSRLVVPYPDRSDVIAEMIQRVLFERERIINEYRTYTLIYNEYARQSLRTFLCD